MRNSIEQVLAVEYGEADSSHQALDVHHMALMKTGGGTSLTKYRWSRVSMMTDQGRETSLADMPFFTGNMQHMLHDTEHSVIEMLPSQPESWYWPKVIGVTGPLHICWNAFKKAMVQSEDWQEYKEILKAVLRVLASPYLRRRFRSKAALGPQESREFDNFRFRMIDWKCE